MCIYYVINVYTGEYDTFYGWNWGNACYRCGMNPIDWVCIHQTFIEENAI